MIAFGPVPSRRLGNSLGINNIPHKTCSYACIYCQVGRTTTKDLGLCTFHEPQTILNAVEEHLSRVEEKVDYLSFVPDGEPTLDINLGISIEKLRPLGIPIAVITNASLLWQKEVRENLYRADWVSLKVDACDERVWRQVNRPDPRLNPAALMKGIRSFAKSFSGELVTETMLVKGVNDGEKSIHEVAAYIASLKPQKAYIAIPTRPPAMKWAQSPDEETVNRAYQLFSRYISRVECLTGYEGNAFSASGDFERDLLSITAVHPLREGAALELCRRNGADWDVLESLMRKEMLVRVSYDGKAYIMRKWKTR